MTESVRLADYVVAFIAKQGIKCVFLVPGGGSMYLCDAIGSSADITYVPNHHEQASAIAADAYSRLSGNLGCALVTTGPGATNALTGCAGAWVESVPLLIISGQVKRADLMGESGLRQKGPQEVDIIPMVRSITKYAVTVLEPTDIRFHLERAVHLAMTGRRGPVWLDIPLDVQNSSIQVDSLCKFEPPAASPKLRRVLEDAAKHVTQLIERSRRPLILAGNGVRIAGAAKDFQSLYDSLQIPVVTTWNASDLIPANHPLSVGKPGVVALRAPNFAVQNCDLLIAIGARLDNTVTAYNPTKFARHASKVIIDIDSRELNKFSTDTRVVRAIQSDAKDFIAALLRQASAVSEHRREWLVQCMKWKKAYPIADGKPFPLSGPISHLHLTKVLSEEIREDTLIVTGSSGLAIEFFYMAFQNKPGQRLLVNSGLGAMGYGLPSMIGASQASDGKPFVGIESDGSLMMNIQELQTLASCRIPVRIFVYNNNGYASIRNTQRNYFAGRHVGTGSEAKLDIPDLSEVARAFGIDAMRVDDTADLTRTVRSALEHPGLLLVDVQVMKDETLWPKSATIPQKDGSMVSMPLEDMSPLLPREELRANMIVPLDPASENVPPHLIAPSVPARH
jgi:acetolactate synthase-1/2/3 large subunit